MERRSWFKKIGVAVLGLSSVALLGAFRHGGGHGGWGHGDPAKMEQRISKHVDEVLKEIQATPEQRTKILAVKDRMLEKAKALHESRKGERQEWLEYWQAPTVDGAQVHARIDERAKGMQTFAHEMADALIEVHDVLTPEQRAKVAEKLRQHRGHGHGHGRGDAAQPKQQPKQ
jgi:protein CpxP